MAPFDQNFVFGHLRALRRKDVDGMLEWMHDEAIASVFQQDFRSLQRDEALAFIESTHASDVAIHLAIVDKNDEYMGTISLKNIDRRNACAEYAIATRAEAHGTGLAALATQDLLRYAFETLELHRVYLCVRTDNIRAKKFYEKMGFMHEGTAHGALLVNGTFYDLDWYAILRFAHHDAGNR